MRTNFHFNMSMTVEEIFLTNFCDTDQLTNHPANQSTVWMTIPIHFLYPLFAGAITSATYLASALNMPQIRKFQSVILFHI